MVLLTIPFGRAYRDDFTRIYDKDALLKMTKPFRIEREEYYIKNDGENEWNLAEQSFIVNAPPENITGCVACVISMKD